LCRSLESIRHTPFGWRRGRKEEAADLKISALTTRFLPIKRVWPTPRALKLLLAGRSNYWPQPCFLAHLSAINYRDCRRVRWHQTSWKVAKHTFSGSISKLKLATIYAGA